jgi:hypothetical protein
VSEEEAPFYSLHAGSDRRQCSLVHFRPVACDVTVNTAHSCCPMLLTQSEVHSVSLFLQFSFRTSFEGRKEGRRKERQSEDDTGRCLDALVSGRRSLSIYMYLFIFNYALQPLRLIVLSGLDVTTFATRRLHASHHTRAPSDAKVKLWARYVRKFCLNADLHVKFMDLLNAVKLRHGTDGFTFPPKEGVLRIFLT